MIFLDLLPSNARDAAVKFDTLEEMADAADQVLAEQPSDVGASLMPPSVLSTSSIACDRCLPSSIVDRTPQFSSVTPPDHLNALRQTPSRRTAAKETDLCYIHVKFGADAHKCADPSFCKMKNVTRPRPSSSASGNGKAGR